MKPPCTFEPTIRWKLYWCSVCGTTAKAHPTCSTEIIYRGCIGRTPAWRPKPGGYGLGDFVAWIIKRLGIHKLKTCGCNERQAKLNRLWNFSTFRRRMTSPREAWRDLRTAAKSAARILWRSLATIAARAFRRT